MKRLALFTGGVALAVYLIVLAWFSFPPLEIEGAIHLPPSVSFARGHELRNPLWHRSYELDPLGEARHVYHGPLYQLLLGHVLRWTGVDKLPLVLGVLRALCVALCTWAFSSFSTRLASGNTWGTVCVSLACLAMLATLLIYLDGRPELLVVLLVLVGTNVLLMKNGCRTLVRAGQSHYEPPELPRRTWSR
jgi:hypothetical protein